LTFSNHHHRLQKMTCTLLKEVLEGNY
jgi:hypothetical protein